ncbi:MAG: MFS transporter [Candidatus Methanomethylophilus sp.]|nr:MFS transporter [Methanomethylophilus sp.]
MAFRQWLPLIGLTVSVFIFNMSEFMPVGLLTSIADDFGTSESQTGLIISFYAWAVAICSLPLMLLLRKVDYRPMLLMAVLTFTVFQFLSGISTSYWMLMASRIGVALAHSVFWSIAAPLAVSVVEFRYHRFALSVMAVGTSVAMILGLPLGRVIGLAMGWRMSFFAIAAVSVLTLILLTAVFPQVRNPGTFTVKRMPDIYRNRVLVGVYVMIVVFVTGHFTCYSYIEPFLLDAAGLSDGSVTVALTVFGLAGIVGSMIFTKMYDRTRFRIVPAVLLFSGLSMMMFGLALGNFVLLMALCALWGMCYTLFCVISQNETLRAAPADAAPVAMSLQSGIFNAGIASGSIVGGIVIDLRSVNDIGFVASVFALAAFLFTYLWLIRKIRANAETGRENSL